MCSLQPHLCWPYLSIPGVSNVLPWPVLETPLPFTPAAPVGPFLPGLSPLAASELHLNTMCHLQCQLLSCRAFQDRGASQSRNHQGMGAEVPAWYSPRMVPQPAGQGRDALTCPQKTSQRDQGCLSCKHSYICSRLLSEQSPGELWASVTRVLGVEGTGKVGLALTLAQMV